MSIKELLFGGEKELDTRSEINSDQMYSITTYDGKNYRVPGAWIQQNGNAITYKGQYYYVDWDEVEGVLPL